MQQVVLQQEWGEQHIQQKNVLPIILPPVIVSSKTETPPHPMLHPITTLMSVITPSIIVQKSPLSRQLLQRHREVCLFLQALL